MKTGRLTTKPKRKYAVLLIQDLPPQTSHYEMVCTTEMDAIDPVTAPCTIVVVRNPQAGRVGISFYTRVGDAEVDVRFYGDQVGQDMTITHFGAGDRTPAAIGKPGRCKIDASEVRCSMFIHNGSGIHIVAR